MSEQQPLPRTNSTDPMTDAHWLKMQDRQITAFESALRELAGEYGCTVIAPPDPSLPAQGEPCRERRPTEPYTWCYACIASAALNGEWLDVADWRCECGDLNRGHQSGCYRCGAGRPDDA